MASEGLPSSLGPGGPRETGVPSCGQKYSPASHRYFSLLIFQEELQGPFVLDCLDAFVLASALRGRVGSQSQTFMEHLLEL